jgi:hypothetical protein
MLIGIAKIAATDEQAASLLCRAKECAEIYLLVSKRQKGCDGMGELAMIREELREALDCLARYCNDEDSFCGDAEYDLDRLAHELSTHRQATTQNNA